MHEKKQAELVDAASTVDAEKMFIVPAESGSFRAVPGS
jgi:hypothetical protein